jgi:hypothetical protein
MASSVSVANKNKADIQDGKFDSVARKTMLTKLLKKGIG